MHNTQKNKTQLPHNVRQAPLPLRAFELQHLDAFEEENITVELAGALDVEDEVVPHAAQLHLVLEFFMSQAFPADCVLEGITDDCLQFASTVFISTSALGSFFPGNGFQLDNTFGEALGELLGVLANDGTLDLDVRQETVGGCGHGRELGVIGSNALNTVHFHIDCLPGTEFGDQNIGVNRLDGIITNKVFFLTTNRMENYILGVDVGIAVQFARVLLVRRSIRVLGAFNAQVQHNCVEVAGGTSTFRIVFCGLLKPAHPADAFSGTLEGDQTQSLCEDLILDNRCVIVNEDVFDGQGGHFGHEDTAEGIGNRCVESD